MSCWVWRNKHPGESACAGCGRNLAVKDGYCRLCWQRARYQSRLAGAMPRGAVSVLDDGGRLPWHQLFFDRMQLRRPEGPVRRHDRRGAPRGKAATLERLRVDRQLQEALAAGPDPLHLASVFGLDPKTAIRYAENARQLLATAAEEQDPAGSRGDA
jgi:hypothetical protein